MQRSDYLVVARDKRVLASTTIVRKRIDNVTNMPPQLRIRFLDKMQNKKYEQKVKHQFT